MGDGLTARERRWVTLTCLAAAEDEASLDRAVRSALDAGDVDARALLEFVLHFAVYCGWPKASALEGVVRRQLAAFQAERGEDPMALPPPRDPALAGETWADMVAQGSRVFEEVNLMPAPQPETPYLEAGVIGFVFGHLWRRPGLARRERRIVSISCVATGASPIPVQTHVGMALRSGDLAKQEMDEIVSEFGEVFGTDRATVLSQTAASLWEQLQAGAD